MKLKLKEEYWTKKENWQKTANKTLWIAQITTLILAGNYYITNNYFMGIIITLVFLILLPQRITYSKYSKDKTRKELGLEVKQ